MITSENEVIRIGRETILKWKRNVFWWFKRNGLNASDRKMKTNTQLNALGLAIAHDSRVFGFLFSATDTRRKWNSALRVAIQMASSFYAC